MQQSFEVDCFEVAYEGIDGLFERLLRKFCVFQRDDEISAHLEGVDLELDQVQPGYCVE